MKCSPLILTLTGLLAAAPATCQQRLLDNFASGSDAAWTRNDNLQPAQLGSTQYSVLAGRYRIASSTSLPPLPQGVITGSWFTASQADPVQYANGLVRMLVRMENDTTNAMILLRYQANGQGYFFALNNHENYLIAGILTATGGSNLAASPFPIASQTDYILEASCMADRMALKVWTAANQEPLAPQLVFTDNRQQQGGFWMGVYNQPSIWGGYGGPLDARFDDVMFTPYPVVSSFGTACAGTLGGQAPYLAAAGHPIRGGNLLLEVQGNGTLLGIAIGTLPGAVQLGLPCPLLVADTAVFLLGSLRRGSGDLTVQIPPNMPPMSLVYHALTSNSALTQFAASQGLQLTFQP